MMRTRSVGCASICMLLSLHTAQSETQTTKNSLDTKGAALLTGPETGKAARAPEPQPPAVQNGQHLRATPAASLRTAR